MRAQSPRAARVAQRSQARQTEAAIRDAMPTGDTHNTASTIRLITALNTCAILLYVFSPSDLPPRILVTHVQPCLRRPPYHQHLLTGHQRSKSRSDRLLETGQGRWAHIDAPNEGIGGGPKRRQRRAEEQREGDDAQDIPAGVIIPCRAYKFSMPITLIV